jgi:hypothetical protein
LGRAGQLGLRSDRPRCRWSLPAVRPLCLLGPLGLGSHATPLRHLRRGDTNRLAHPPSWATEAIHPRMTHTSRASNPLRISPRSRSTR